MFNGPDNVPQGKQLSHQRGFCFTTGGGDGVVLRVRACHNLWQTAEQVFMQLTFCRVADVMREIVFDKIIVARHRVADCRPAGLCGLRVNIEPQTFSLDGLAEVGDVLLQASLKLFNGKFTFCHVTPALLLPALFRYVRRRYQNTG